jgi:hypothetical protein
MLIFPLNRTAMIPNKLVQTHDLDLVREPSDDFTYELVKTMQSEVFDAIDYNGPEIADVASKERRRHRQNHGYDYAVEVCVFKMVEEDYEMPYTGEKIEISEFAFICEVCGDRHDVRVVR